MNQYRNKEKAVITILEPLIKLLSKPQYLVDDCGSVATIIKYKHRFLLLVGKSDTLRLPDISKRELENMLNLLRGYSLLSYDYILCGDAFSISINLYKLPHSETAKIIDLKRPKKAA